VKVVRFRRTRAWSTERLASWLGCSPDAVQLWEAGKRRVPGWVLEAFELEREAA
jgi:DNA-binding transcriptional regulator YiaG